MDELTKAELGLSKKWFRIYFFYRRVGKIISFFPFYPIFVYIFSFIKAVNLNRAVCAEATYRKYTKKKALGEKTNPIDFDSGYGYNNPEEERRVGLMYKAEIVSGIYHNRESPILYEHVISTLSNILSQGKIKRVINFGVSYAYVDSVVASRFPEVQFIGVDRSPASKQLNEEEFSLPNLSFVAGDIMDLIGTQSDMNETVFFSMRTCVLLPQHFIENLYRQLTQKNIEVILGFEPYGLSRETDSVYQQEYKDKKSVLFRDTMYLHNYAGILFSNGYRIDRLEYIKTDHVDSDVRYQSFSAHRA